MDTSLAGGLLEGAVVRLDSKTRVIRTVEGSIRVRDATSAEQAAKSFVESTFRLSFDGSGPTKVVLDRNTDTLVGRRFLYQLYYVRTDTHAALPIAGGVLTVHVNHDNLISYASNDTVTISNPIVIRLSSTLPRTAAEKIALAQQGRDATVVAASQIVAVSQGTPVLLWKVNVLQRSPAGSFEILVDRAGRVVSSRNTSVFKGR